MSEPNPLDTVRLRDIRSIPDMTGLNGHQPNLTTWHPINLAELDEHPPLQPNLTTAGILYPGERHVFSGPPESAKTIAAYALGIQIIRNSGSIVIIDFEMGRWQARDRLRDLGATNPELLQVYYVDPDEPATTEHIQRLANLRPQLVIIDAAAGAYDNLGLDDNKRSDVEKFTSMYVDTFWKAQIATIVLDHVVKNTDQRGAFAIGSERKLGALFVHLGFQTLQPIKRGSKGNYKITTHKDRGGYLKRGHLADLHLTSDPETHQITWEFNEAEEHEDTDDFRPTHLMEKVSRWLEEEGGAHSGNQIEKAKLGKNDYVRKALKCLTNESFVAKSETGRGYEYSHILAYRQADDLAPEEPPIQAGNNLAPTSPHLAPDEVSTTSPLAPPSIGGGEVERRSEIDVYDPKVQARLDDDDIPF